MKNKSNIDFYLLLLKSLFFRFAIGSVDFVLVVSAIIGIKKLVNVDKATIVSVTEKIIAEKNNVIKI